MTAKQWITSWLLLAACFLTAGCGGRGEPLGKVFGTVTLQDQPVAGGSIVFANAEKGVYMSAPLKQDGSYEVATARGQGLPLGTYRVSLAPPPGEPLTKDNPKPKPRTEPEIPPRYRDAKTSKLQLEVKEGDNQFDVRLQP